MATDAQNAFTVNFISMQNCADAIREASKLIDDITNDLERLVTKALDYWQESAKQEYLTAKSNWEAAIGQMSGLLNTSSRSMNLIHDNFLTANRNNTLMWQK